MKGRDIMFQRTKCSAGKRCFHRKAPRSKYTEAGCQKQWVWREATSLLRHPPLSCDKNATLRRGRASARIEEREFWAGWSVCPRWDSRPSRIFSPHTTWPLTSLATTLQCSCCLAKPVLNCARRPLQPVPHAVPCGS